MNTTETPSYNEMLATIAKANDWTEARAFDHCSAMDSDEFQVVYDHSVRHLNRSTRRTFIDPAKQATEKQWAFVRSLAEGFLHDEDQNRVNIATALLDTQRETHSKKTASALIDMFKVWQQEDRAKAREQRATRVDSDAPEGIHFHNDTVYKVQVAVHGSGKKYAKRLNTDTSTFDYVGRAPLAHLSDATLMTLEQAKEFGHLYGMCCKCGRTLTDENSIAQGIGPVCAQSF